MVFRKFLQGTALVFVFASLASASSLRDWEDGIDDSGPEDGLPRGLLEERSQVFEENEPTESIEITEVAISPKRQNFAAKPRKDLAQVPLRSKGAEDITDETAITGENAKKRLPSYVTQNQAVQPPFLHEINQVTTGLMPMGFQDKAD